MARGQLENGNGTNGRVVVVNDDTIQLRLLTGILNKGGIPARGYSDVETALSGMHPDSPPPAVVTDLHMPGIDGWRFCRLLRSQEYAPFNGVPILVVSATFAGDDTREITAATGANAFLPCPVESEEFLSTVRGLVRGSAIEHRRAKVLIVDDSRTVRRLLEAVFERRGYKALSAGTGVEARLLFEAEKPEMAVLDYHLPDDTGEFLLQDFSRADHMLVCVMITTDPAPELALRWMRMGAAAYVRKPFEAEYLLTVCEHAARERVMLRVEEVLEHRTQCLHQAQKMEAVGQLAGGVAHDFNNLLQVISGYTELALTEMDRASPVARHLSEVLEAAGKAQRLIRQLLTFSRRQTTRPGALDLNSFVEKELAMVRRLIGEHIQLEFRAGDGLPELLVDSHQVAQVLLNLCVNARDAMPEGGRLFVTTKSVVLDADYGGNCSWDASGDYVCLEISDTGCGMTRETQERIFEPFYTTKEMGKGTGLGLAMVYGIVKQHGGFIQVHSEPDEGTVFRVYFPVTEEANADDLPAGQLSEMPAGGSETILLAEDETQVRELAVKFLESSGYQILIATNGIEALEQAQRHRDEIDLLILDVIMPEKNGPAVLEMLRTAGCSAPALFVSGYSHDVLNTRQLPAEGARLLQKPFGQRELLAAVRGALDLAPHAP